MGAVQARGVLGLVVQHQDDCPPALTGDWLREAGAERDPRGQQLGVPDLGWTDAAAEDPLMHELGAADVGVFRNDDVVVTLPDGSAVLTRTPQGEVQATRLGPSVWGLQRHPEVDDAILRTWAEEDLDRYAAGEVERVLAEVAAARPGLEEQWRPITRALVRVAAGQH